MISGPTAGDWERERRGVFHARVTWRGRGWSGRELTSGACGGGYTLDAVFARLREQISAWTGLDESAVQLTITVGPRSPL